MAAICGMLDETRVKRGARIVVGRKELLEKLRRNDLSVWIGPQISNAVASRAANSTAQTGIAFFRLATAPNIQLERGPRADSARGVSYQITVY